MTALFDDIERTDAGLSPHQEGAFAFYNRISTPGWSRVRDELERWFTSYSHDAEPEKANDLRARFRSADQRQHHAAWWELYVHRLLRALYPDDQVVCEPQQPSGTRPDFAVVDQDSTRRRLFVECTTATLGIIEDASRNSALLAYVLDAINELKSEHFWVHLDARRYGATQPKRREIQEPLKKWLATLDYDTIRDAGAGASRFSCCIEFRDWALEVAPVAKKDHQPGDRLIGFGPSSGGFINDAAILKQAVARKAGRYGALDAPFVIAVAPTAPLIRDDDVAQALLWTRQQQFDPAHPEGGEITLVRDGAFYQRAAQVTGVLLGAEVLPWTITRTSPTLWLNPQVAIPPDEPFERLTTVRAEAKGDLRRLEPSCNIADLLELELEWPGDFWSSD